MKIKKVLVISPHFDDFALAMGGTLIKLKEKEIDIKILIVTQPFNEIQEEERGNALDYIGSSSFQLPYKTVTLDTIPKREIIDKFTDILDKAKPDIIFTNHWNDYHTDHKIISECMNVATRPYLMKANTFAVLFYECSCKAENIYSPIIPNLYIPLDDELFDKKLSLISYYHTELREVGHPRSIDGIESMARYRGSQIGKKYAEAFTFFRGVVEL